MPNKRQPFFRSSRLISIVTCAVLFILTGALQACGGSTNATSNSGTTITIAYGQYGPPPYYEQQWLDEVNKQFEAAHPSVKVKLLPIIADETGYYTKLALMMRSSNPPDIVHEDSFLISSDVNAGYLLPLDNYLNSWPEYKQQWTPSMQQMTTFNDHNYAIMTSTDVRCIWYNKNIFQKANLPSTWQPNNWADIISAARAIKAKEPDVIPMNLYSGVPLGEAASMQGFEMLLYGTNNPLYNYSTKKWVVSSPGFKDALNFVKTVYNPADLLGPTNDIELMPNANNVVPQQLIPESKLGIDIDGCWIARNWQPKGTTPWPEWKDVMGTAKMPTEFGQDPKYVTLSGGWSYAIGAHSPNKDLAFEWLKLAHGKDLLTKHTVLIGGTSPRKDSVDNPSYKNIPMSAFSTSLLEYTHFRPGFPAYPKISQEIGKAMQQVMQGQSPTDAMNAFSQAATAIAGPDNVEQKS
ncbi:extracellular solute-binding protein [Ktedonosporobacter rubrisoli]|uniref:Extracellular solute-binding protein n=1 Tax=Ktedonosporobacter rubrisoli TaxID=2509675 RepID=A0A4P6JPW6_KTERU|nr:extracellular solute-binding protein [Ktedonosporobacter rubrisoli]QBD77438.1 extracellular solute-binding protein [Ktedonosporobacter rubrisoli]